MNSPFFKAVLLLGLAYLALHEAPRTSVPARQPATPKPETMLHAGFSLSGQGLPRFGWEKCRSELAAFERALEASEIELEVPMYCKALPNEPTAFAPQFLARYPVIARVQTLAGPRQSTIAYCELARQRLVSQARRDFPHLRVVESYCRPVPSAKIYDRTGDLFEPMALVLSSERPPRAEGV